MGHQGPCSLPGPRVIAVEDAYVEQVLEDDVKRRNEIAYDFVGDIVRATGFPCVSLPEFVSHFAEPDSESGWISGSMGMTFWKCSLALAMGWSNSASTSVFTSSPNTLFSISLVKIPSNWDTNVSSFFVVVIDLIFIPPSSLETRVG